MGYLDEEGLKWVWGKLIALLGKKADVDNPGFSEMVTGGYLPSNPADGGAPYLGCFINDIAFLNYRGGSVVCRNLANNEVIHKNHDLDFLFDGKISPTILCEKNLAIEIVIKLPQFYYWATAVGVDFNRWDYAPTEWALDVGYSANNAGNAENPDSDIIWERAITQSGKVPIAFRTYIHAATSDHRINYLRFATKIWDSDWPRLAQIILVNYDSDGAGSTLLNRGGDTMYGDIKYRGDGKGIRFYDSHVVDKVRGAIEAFNDYDDGGVFGNSSKDNLMISSWWSIGFHDLCFGHDYISMNVRDGIFRAKKLQDTDTGKQTSIGDLATITELDEVRKIAEGKTATYAVKAQNVDSTKYCNNKLNIAKSELGTTSVRIDKQGITKLLDINNKEIDLSTLGIGDIVFTAEQTIKDWWFAGTTAAYYLFYGFDADTPDLSGYVKNTELANYTPLTDFNNLKDSLGTASKCDFSESISDSIVDTGTGTLRKKELPTTGAIKTYLNTYFMRKSNLGEAASHGVDTSIGTLSVISANLPTTAAVIAYVTEKTKLKTINGITLSGEGDIALPTATKKIQFTHGNSGSSYLLLGKFKPTTDNGNGGAVHIHGYIGIWDGVDAKTLVDILISNRGGLSIKGSVKGKTSDKYDIFCTKDSSDYYYIYIKAQTFTIGQLEINYDDWDEFGGFEWLCNDTWSNGYAGSSNVSCISKLLPHDTYYGSFDASTGEVDVKAVTGGPSGSIVTIFGNSYSNGGTVSIQRLAKIWTDHDCVAINVGYQQGAMISATGFVPPGKTYHCFADNAIEVYVHVFDL